ncbi:nicotinamidase [Marinospirillum sp.]|uniref:nicotinamidase n=1 Tax=Marinospirillum sp. TaxID=2183934 RepID=UPI0028703AD1|nr:nicotinamidase [Marinospirillum sp.]MDR9467906.1 nicotinamidase [Marinospirillum sp.]
MTISPKTLHYCDALLVVDVQKDFCPGGALAIEGGDEVVPLLNSWIEAVTAEGLPVYFSRDWHPVNHISFEEQGGPWPPHCIQDTDGAAFHPDLQLPESAVKVTKGVRFDQDQNSAFDQTGLAEQLRKDSVRRLIVGGLAEDVCVLATVLDACKEGFEVILLQEATRPVTREGGEKARSKMRAAGAQLH